jgi:hypothetical protein
MINQRKALSLFGETVREVGVLSLVFVPLDLLFRPAPVSSFFVIFLMGCGCLSIFTGIVLEAWQWNPPR